MGLYILTFIMLFGMWLGHSQVSTAVEKRLESTSKGISIIPPPDWNVKENQPGVTWFFTAPTKAGDPYERNIRVMSFVDSIYIDEVSFISFANKIKDNFSKASNSIKNYEIRDFSTVELLQGTTGGLFYADFLLAGVPMMQMHILVSSAKNHFLLTYTDTRSRFEDTSNGYLDEAYTSMQSITVNSHPPQRYDFAIRMGLLVGVVLFLLITLSFFRRYKMESLNQAYEEMEHMMKYYHYLLDRGQHITLAQLTPSNYSFKSICKCCSSNSSQRCYDFEG